MNEEAPAIRSLQDLINEYAESGRFGAAELVLDKDAAGLFVRMRRDPRRFLPDIFQGDWADPETHPRPGKVRVLRVMQGADSVIRVIARQGKFLYAYPWIG
jgi:hypothetical protein